MVSNALERSKNILAVISLLLAAFTILSRNLITAIFLECLGQKPNWFSKRTLHLFKKEIHLLKTSLSSILENPRKIEIGLRFLPSQKTL